MAGKENPGSISSSMAGVAIPVRHQGWSQHPNLTPNQELDPCPPANSARPANKMGFCNGPSVVNPLRALILPPVSCFCPGSAHGRHLMGSDEEEVGQSR